MRPRGGVEGRVALASSLILCLSSYFGEDSALLALIVSSIFTNFESLKLLRTLSPLFVFFAISALAYPQSLKLALTFAAIISAGSLVLFARTSQLASALLLLRVPEKAVSAVCVAVSFFHLLLWDYGNIREVQTSRVKILKVSAALAVLRSVGLAEALYSKCYSYKVVAMPGKVTAKDTLLLLASATIFLYSTDLLDKFIYVLRETLSLSG
ncbi:MAG: hypothetical protein ABWW66_03250 [Archaeoglobaceae archaeon]